MDRLLLETNGARGVEGLSPSKENPFTSAEPINPKPAKWSRTGTMGRLDQQTTANRTLLAFRQAFRHFVF